MQANPNFVSKAVENHERNEVDKDIEMTFFTNICEGMNLRNASFLCGIFYLMCLLLLLLFFK